MTGKAQVLENLLHLNFTYLGGHRRDRESSLNSLQTFTDGKQEGTVDTQVLWIWDLWIFWPVWV